MKKEQTHNYISSQKQQELNMQDNQNIKIKYQLSQQPFQVPNNIKRQVPILKNLFQLNQESKQINYNHANAQLNSENNRKLLKTNIFLKEEEKNQSDSAIIIDPIIMKSSIMKCLLTQKLLACFSFFSIILSFIMVYFIDQKVDNKNSMISDNVKFMIFLGNFITCLMVINLIFGFIFQSQNQKITKINEQQQQTFEKKEIGFKNILKLILKMFITVLHPTIYTLNLNYLLHLAMIIRIFFIFTFLIKSSQYHDCRTFRLTQIYGIKSKNIFIFAIKSIVQSMKISHVIAVYCLVVLIFTHTLYLVSQYQTYQTSLNGSYSINTSPQNSFKFIDCFQIIVFTLPTIGYGQFLLTSIYQRTIILIVMIVGASMNSFITLIMLKQFQMTQQQSNSYNLLNKLKLHGQMDQLSQKYIVQTINQIRCNINYGHSYQQQKQKRIQRLKCLDRTYKESYNYCKTKYSQLIFKDTSSTFSLFRTSLTKLKVSTQQLNNMIFVLLNKLAKFNKKMSFITRKHQLQINQKKTKVLSHKQIVRANQKQTNKITQKLK